MVPSLITEPSPLAIHSLNKPGAQTTAKTRVLLVEDSPVDSLLVRRLLSHAGDRQVYGPVFAIQCVDRLSTALQSLAAGEFDIVLLDLSLPDSHGLEEAFLRVRTSFPTVPIIVMTGHGDEGLGLKIVREGAQDYMIKGQVDRPLLIKTIRYAIERNRSEQALRESEEKFRSIVETTNEWIWSIDVQGNLTYSNPAVETILGYRPEELVGKLNSAFVHPEDQGKLASQLRESVHQRRGWTGLVLRWRHKDSSYRYLESNAVPVLDTSREILGYRGADRDISERQRAKERRMQLELRLVTVQEEERHRIARELHDQMGQLLAALMLGLKALGDSGEVQAPGLRRLQQLHELADNLARNVHHLALDLRPTALDDLGLHIALSNYVEEWSERFTIPADFHSNGLTKQRLPLHIETTIYRIVQEALTNVLRHALATNVSIIVERRANRVLAIIEDDGCGFDADAMISMPARERRLGLLGMQERLGLVGGTLNIESAPGTGTSLYVQIPIPAHKGEVQIHG